MIKDIIVNVSIDKERDVAGNFAISVAAAFEAHLSAVAFAYEPAVDGMDFTGAAAAVLEDIRAESQDAADRARARFEDACRRASISFDARTLSAGVSDAAVMFGVAARNYDLAIVGQAEPDKDLPESLIAESTLFESGRPVLVVPYIQKDDLKLSRVMVCWDGSRNAARAIADAMPLLQRAKQVDVVTIEHREQRKELRGAEISDHLARHGLKVALNPIVAPDSDVASTVLSYAADSGADLIVMGGYGHSRVREFVLGGATRGILEAMTVPTLMAH
jgi:nucleotide-binding universal stress UspA family protein